MSLFVCNDSQFNSYNDAQKAGVVMTYISAIVIFLSLIFKYQALQYIESMGRGLMKGSSKRVHSRGSRFGQKSSLMAAKASVMKYVNNHYNSLLVLLLVVLNGGALMIFMQHLEGNNFAVIFNNYTDTEKATAIMNILAFVALLVLFCCSMSKMAPQCDKWIPLVLVFVFVANCVNISHFCR